MLNSQAQKYDIPLNYNLSQEVLIVKSDSDSLFHTGIKPFNQWYISNKTFNNTFKDTGKYYYDFTVLLYQKHLLEIHQKDVRIGMDLLFDVDLGRRYFEDRTTEKTHLSTNTRGFRIVANIGKRVSFETRFFENQIFYPHYIDSMVNNRDVAPGIGRAKRFKGVGYDAGYSMGTIGFKINNQLNLKFGHDKLFIGHGYRSLLLSDNASNYPYLMFNARSKNNKWQYMSAIAWMQSLYRSTTVVSTEALFKRKDANFHYLSFRPNKNLEIGLFEGTIFKTYQNGLGFVAPSPFFYNPLIGLNTVLFGLQTENNSLIGLSASYNISSFELFGQLAMDDVDKIGFQLGGKYFEPFNLKRNWVQIEYNSVPSYMYTQSRQNLLQNYSHMNQELAHPLGASFNELILLYHYEKDHWFGNFQFNYTYRKRGADIPYGENILIANDNPNIASTSYENIQTYYFKLEGGYRFNIKTRLQLFGQMAYRTLTSLQSPDKHQFDYYYTFGIRCNLSNFYLDL